MAGPVRSRRRVWLLRAIPVVVVALIAGGIFGTQAFASSGGDDYRLAGVTKATIVQTLTLSGTATAVNQATASFPDSGTVASVPVGIGDTVTKGQTLATLDTSALEQTVVAAKATLAQAKATLAGDEDGTGSLSTGGSSGTGSASSSSNASTIADTITGTTSGAVAVEAAYVMPTTCTTTAPAAQQVTCWQNQANALIATTIPADQAAVTADLAAQAKDCPTPSNPSNGSLSTCLTDIQKTITDQGTLQADQVKLQTAQTNLEAALKALATTGSGGGGGSGGSTGSGGTGKGSTGSKSFSGGSGSTGSSGSSSRSSAQSTDTPQRIASDKSAIISAQSALTKAEEAVTDATLKAPISGTVAALGYTAGQASGSGSVTIVGTGPVDVTVDVPLTSLKLVKVGQAATVTAAGSATPMTATVHSISLLPASSTSTTVSYPVVVRVGQPSPSLASGSTGSVTITLATAANVLSVPNSALTTVVSGTAFVSTMTKGKLARTIVRTGAVGADRTQVLSGLSAGQQVVIADLSEALPSSSATTSRFGARTSGGLSSTLSGSGGLGGAGGFGGGGFGGGGFRGGGG